MPTAWSPADLTDERVRRGFEAQLATRRSLLADGAVGAGWKVGLTARPLLEKLGLNSFALGFLTDRGRLGDGDRHSLGGTSVPLAEAEVALRIGTPPAAEPDLADAERSVAAAAAAIELVDIDRPMDDPTAILAGNVYHRAFALGAWTSPDCLFGDDEVELEIGIDGTTRERSAWRDYAPGAGAVVRFVQSTLTALGLGLEPGDVILSGTLTRPLPIAPGNRVTVSSAYLGTIGIAVEK